MEYRDMVDYVDNRTGQVLKAVENLNNAFVRHETWHRTNLESQLRANRFDGWQSKLFGLSVVSSIVSAAGVVAVLMRK